MKISDLFKVGDKIIITYKKDLMYNKKGVIVEVGNNPFPIKVEFENGGSGFYNPDMVKNIKNISIFM